MDAQQDPCLNISYARLDHYYCLDTLPVLSGVVPINRILEWEPGTGTAVPQLNWGRLARAWSCWLAPISKARRPEDATRAAATGRTDSKRSTARRVITSNVFGATASARAFRISTSVNVRARVTSRRKAAFL